MADAAIVPPLWGIPLADPVVVIREDRAGALLIGRQNGSSSSRRQYRFRDEDRARAAVTRWAREGFNGFWLYLPTPDADDASAYLTREEYEIEAGRA